MQSLHERFRQSLSLLTDLYQLTMACGYWKLGRAGEQAVFHLSFSKNPFSGGYAVAAGLADALDWLTWARFDDGDVEYLRSLRGGDEGGLFPEDFLKALGGFRFTVDVDAMPEGTVAF